MRARSRTVAAFRTIGPALVVAGLLSTWAAPLSAAPGRSEAGDRRGTRAPAEVIVEMSVLGGFSPASVEIETGTTVVWRNTDQVDYPVIGGSHQVVADDGSFGSPQVEPGSSWAKTFLEPGEFPYHCGNHAFMTGTIVVTGEPISEEEAARDRTVEIVEPDAADTDTWGFKPPDITVESGTTVTWRNTGAQEHTATSEDNEFDSGPVGPGESFSFTFDEPGVFGYRCEPHPWMEGTIRVAEPGKAPPPDTSDPDDGEADPPPPPPPPPPATEGAGPATYTVHVVEGESTDSWGFDPTPQEVGVGDTVVWRNTGSIEHTVTADDGTFDSGLLGTDATFEHTFDQVGTFTYTCDPHPFMTGTIVVSETAPPPAPGDAGDASSAGGAPEEAPPEEPAPVQPDEVEPATARAASSISGIDWARTGWLILVALGIGWGYLLFLWRDQLSQVRAGAP